MGINKHHVAHGRQEWRLRPESRRIREHPRMMTLMDIDSHQALHDNCPAIPLLGFHAMRKVASLWTPGDDVFESISNLQFAIEGAMRQPKMHPLERQLGALMIEIVGLQVPYIREGIIERPERVPA